jgi:para-nitrobenzyl esterase
MQKLSQVLIALIIPAFISCSSLKQNTASKIDINMVPTEAGFVSGETVRNDSVKVFMGIPFAAPPVDSLRWRPPQPVQEWEGVKACITPPASAMQSPPVPFMMWSKEFMAPLEPLSEDCLYLNIWTAARNTADKLPVMVWIHGGAFTGGSGTVPLYDGQEMAKKGVVFVTINYRLGVFGFLAHPQLSQESPDSVSGNYGILDQIAALTWVKKNIEAFGGDPENVTIDGQSAGSFSVNALMVSPLAKGLFQRAIGQSGAMFSMNFWDLESSEQVGEKYLEQAKVSSIAELRKVPADELIKIPGRWGMTIDGHVLLPPEETFAEDKQNDVPLISGWNADDGVSMGKPMNAADFRKDAQKKYGKETGEFLKLFPAANDEEASQSQKLLTQLSFGYTNYKWVLLQSTAGTHKAYLYYFTRVPPGQPDYGAFHSSEFGYALHTLRLWDRPFTKTDYDLSDMMSSYWVNFAKTGDPNGQGLPEWPAFDPNAPKVIELGDVVKETDVPYLKQLEFIDSLNK